MAKIHLTIKVDDNGEKLAEVLGFQGHPPEHALKEYLADHLRNFDRQEIGYYTITTKKEEE